MHTHDESVSSEPQRKVLTTARHSTVKVHHTELTPGIASNLEQNFAKNANFESIRHPGDTVVTELSTCHRIIGTPPPSKLAAQRTGAYNKFRKRGASKRLQFRNGDFQPRKVAGETASYSDYHWVRWRMLPINLPKAAGGVSYYQFYIGSW